mmetsp:Transcript_37127/g.82602  ORF Transcript_37127/g.82602 Transcript_37127/m.82602 type:complete len:215 (-) Transcript_37127:566-1210(-)
MIAASALPHLPLLRCRCHVLKVVSAPASPGPVLLHRLPPATPTSILHPLTCLLPASPVPSSAGRMCGACAPQYTTRHSPRARSLPPRLMQPGPPVVWLPAPALAALWSPSCRQWPAPGGPPQKTGGPASPPAASRQCAAPPPAHWRCRLWAGASAARAASTAAAAAHQGCTPAPEPPPHCQLQPPMPARQTYWLQPPRLLLCWKWCFCQCRDAV